MIVHIKIVSNVNNDQIFRFSICVIIKTLVHVALTQNVCIGINKNQCNHIQMWKKTHAHNCDNVAT